MNTDTVNILKEFNSWRRGREGFSQPHPTIIGKAIDDAIRLIYENAELKEQLHKGTLQLGNALSRIAMDRQTLQIIATNDPETGLCKNGLSPEYNAELALKLP